MSSPIKNGLINNTEDDIADGWVNLNDNTDGVDQSSKVDADTDISGADVTPGESYADSDFSEDTKVPDSSFSIIGFSDIADNIEHSPDTLLSQAKENIETLQQQINAQVSLIEQTEHEKTTLLAEWTENGAQAENTRSQLQQTIKLNEQTQAKQQQELTKQQAQILVLKSSIDALKQKTTTQASSIEQLKQEKNSLQDESTTKDAQASEKMRQLQTQLAQAKDTIRQQQADLVQEKKTTSQQQQEIKRNKQTHTEQLKESTRQKAQLLALEKQFGELKDDSKKQQVETEDKAAKILMDYQMLQSLALSTMASNVTSIAHLAQGKIKTLEQQVDALASSIKQLQSDSTLLQAEHAKKDTQTKDTISQLRQQIELNKQTQTKQQAQILALKSTHSELKDKTTDQKILHETAIDAMKSERERLTSNIAAQNHTETKQSKQISQLEKQLIEKTSDLEKLEHTLNTQYPLLKRTIAHQYQNQQATSIVTSKPTTSTVVTRTGYRKGYTL